MFSLYQDVSPEWQIDRFKVIELTKAIEMKLDIVIELGTQLAQAQVDALKRSGSKVGEEARGSPLRAALTGYVTTAC